MRVARLQACCQSKANSLKAVKAKLSRQAQSLRESSKHLKQDLVQKVVAHSSFIPSLVPLNLWHLVPAAGLHAAEVACAHICLA
jgi:hypothetical protein